jgi:hypothetical protein
MITDCLSQQKPNGYILWENAGTSTPTSQITINLTRKAEYISHIDILVNYPGTTSV